MNYINEKWCSILKNMILICLLIAFLGASFNWSSARKIVYFCSVIAFFILLFSQHKIKKMDFLLPFSIFIFGGGVLLWIWLFGSWGGQYYSYQSLAKITIASSILMCLYSTEYFSCILSKKPIQNLLCMIWFFLVGAILIVSCYQYFYLHIGRAAVGSSIATMAAYIVSIAGLLGIAFAQRKNDTKWSILFLVVLFIVVYTSILLTETRSVILGFPLLFAIAVLAYKDKIHMKQLFCLMSMLIVILMLLLYTFGDRVQGRMNDIVVDIHKYTQQQNTESSFGARIAMFHAGSEAGKHGFMGQSIEDRASVIKQYVNQYPVYAGVLPYVYTNLHNEIIENFSLRGVWGVALLLFLYFSVVCTAIKQRNSILLAIGLSFMIYGLTDVIFSDDLPLSYYIAIIFVLCLHNNKFAKEKQPSIC
ncbi:O-antigen ligase family protein [Neisseria sp. Ec49-e6-T10]|uniref:O-antigen ligase family protein n=1 Tax=Neisseria sp. Ec49-e6-T10 TaxID=3140744 RepID=UPI003EBC8F29